MSTGAQGSRSAADGDAAARWTPYWFIAPVSLYLFLFQGVPLLQELYLSFTSTSLLSPREHVFVGFDNYRDLFQASDFANTLVVTAIYTAACVVLAIGFGLAAALLLDSPFFGRAVARALVTIPWAAPPVAVALIFSWMFNAQYGVFNYAQRVLGIRLSRTGSTSAACAGDLITTIWQIFPFASVVIRRPAGRFDRCAKPRS